MNTNPGTPQSNGGAPAELRSYAERIVRLKGEIKGLQGDVKDVKSEAAGRGFDKKALDVVVARMLEDETSRAARMETESLAEVYLASLGMLDGTPLGDATRRRADEPPPPIPMPRPEVTMPPLMMAAAMAMSRPMSLRLGR